LVAFDGQARLIDRLMSSAPRCGILTTQKRERFAFATFYLVHRALTGLFIGAPTKKLCAVPKSAASKMVVGNFNHHSWIDWFPFARAIRTPTTRTPGRAAGESRLFFERFKLLCQLATF
jgi:hypothetical protein